MIFTRKQTWGKEATIALIDDSLTFWGIVKKALMKSSFDGHIACYPFARAFYDMCVPFPDVVVCDLSMPGDDGWDILKWLKDRDFDGHFILCTGDSELFEDSFSVQRDVDFIIKPFEPSLFIGKIKECLT